MLRAPVGGHPLGVGLAISMTLGDRAETTDRAAEFAELFRAHCDFVWRVLRRLGLSPAEAEDGVQEVFIVVANKLETYEERGAIRAWLFTVARQVASHARRANARRKRRDEMSEPPSEALDPHQVAERQEAAAMVERFLGELDEGQAMVFYLSEVEGLSAPEIARAMQLEVSTIYGRQRVSRKQFEAFVRRNAKLNRVVP